MHRAQPCDSRPGHRKAQRPSFRILCFLFSFLYNENRTRFPFLTTAGGNVYTGKGKKPNPICAYAQTKRVYNMTANTKRNRTEAKIILCVLLICILVAGGYFAHVFGWFAKGNGRAYSVQETQPLEDRPLAGKAILFLGSSVTKGYAAKGESFVDFLRKQDGIGAIKEAVSGTTLVDNGEDSYIARLKRIAPSMSFDMLICQLSTNDATKHMPLGKIADTYDMSDFRTSTVAGAIEYIIAYTQETWGCPVVFYTGTYYESEEYKAMVDLLYAVQEKSRSTMALYSSLS